MSFAANPNCHRNKASRGIKEGPKSYSSHIQIISGVWEKCTSSMSTWDVPHALLKSWTLTTIVLMDLYQHLGLFKGSIACPSKKPNAPQGNKHTFVVPRGEQPGPIALPEWTCKEVVKSGLHPPLGHHKQKKGLRFLWGKTNCLRHECFKCPLEVWVLLLIEFLPKHAQRC